MKEKAGTMGVICLFVIGGFLSGIDFSSQNARALWSIDVVDSVGDVGWDVSMAVDNNGFAHISYSDGTNKDLKYAKWNGSAWNIETVDAVGDIGLYTSIALNDSGYAHISYYDYTNRDLKYAKWNGSAWNIETVDSPGEVGGKTSLALDGSGYPHISYYDFINKDLKYAKWNGSAWSNETVDSPGDVGTDTSIAIDFNGYPHISYSDNTNYVLKYAKWNGTAWIVEVVDYGIGAFYGTPLALDSSGYAHISYLNSTNEDLMLAEWNGTAWNIETVESASDVGCKSSIAIDSNDYVHISYYAWTGTNLKYAKETGGGWSIEIVDSGGLTSSIALDTNGHPHISYYNSSNDDLKYAKGSTNQPTLSWTGEPHYATDGLNPETGNAATSFVYRINYTDADNSAPQAGYPKVHIKKGGAEIAGSPFNMSEVDSLDTNYADGKLYTHATTLSAAGNDYVYYFTTNDSSGLAAIPTSESDAPDVAIPPLLGSVAGRVVDWDTGEPMENALVELFDSNDNEVKNFTTNETGMFILTDIAAGTYAIIATKSGFLPEFSITFDLAAGQQLTLPVDLRLLAIRGSIRGSVMDDAGNPVGMVEVELLDAQDNVIASVTTSSDGLFNFTSVRSGTYKIRASKTDFQTNTTTQFNIIAGEHKNYGDIMIIPVSITEPPPPPDNLLTDYWWVWSIIAIIGILLIILLLIRRKSKLEEVANKEKPTEEEEG